MNTPRTVTHTQHQPDYMKGWEAAQVDLNGMSHAACVAKFNLDNPVGVQPSNLGAYYYASGYADRLNA